MRYPFGLTDEVLDAASAEADPESTAAGTRLRRRFAPELAAAALTQVALRRRAVRKFGDDATQLFFTRDGLEQATRPDVAAHRARRLVQAGARRVADLGCGIGADALAFAAAGLEVVAVERDEPTFQVARANLDGRAEVRLGNAEEVLDGLADDAMTAVFLDPARRTGAGRSWRVEDLSPDWGLVRTALDRTGPTVVKLGPGFPAALLPDHVDAEWIAHHSDTVELALWSGSTVPAGRRSALVLPDHRLVTDPSSAPVPVGDLGAWLLEPLGAVNAAGARPVLAASLDAYALDPSTPYLTTAERPTTPYASAFEVRDAFGFRPAALKAWLRRQEIGVLEIKTRGLDLDPARLRRELRLRGPNSATVVLTRTTAGRTVIVVDRTPADR